MSMIKLPQLHTFRNSFGKARRSRAEIVVATNRLSFNVCRLSRKRLCAASCLLVAVLCALSTFVNLVPAQAAAGVNNTINIQGKVTNSNGTNVTDGTYDFVFKLYNGASSGSTNTFTESWTSASLFSQTVSGTAPSAGGESVSYASDTNESSLKAGQYLWNTTKKEAVKIVSVNTTGTGGTITISPTAQAWANTDTITNEIYVKDGIFQVALNSLNADPAWGTTDFTQDTIFLGVNFNSDGEMKPRSQFTTVPYAFRAKSAAAVDGLSVTAGKTLTISNSLTLAGTDGTTLNIGGNNITFSTSGATSLTLPSSGTLATLAGTEALTNKTVNGLNITSTTGTLTIAAGKTLTANNSVSLSGTDGIAVNFGGNNLTLTTSGATNLTLPTSGTVCVTSTGCNQANTNTGSGAAGQITYYTGTNTQAGSNSLYWATGTSRLGVNTAGSPGATLDVSSSETTANAAQINANSLTTGLGLSIGSTSTTMTTGGLLGLSWVPGSSTTMTGDLFSINVGPNGTVGNILNLMNDGLSVFSVSQSQITANVPVAFNATGDFNLASGLYFSNTTQANITSAAPIQITAGESYNSSNLTLSTYNNGMVVLDTATTTTNGKVGIGTSSPTAKLHVKGGLSNAAAGTVAVTNASAAVVGTSTSFTTAFNAGDAIGINGVAYTILSITDNTHLTLTANYAGSTASGLTAYYDSAFLAIDNGAGTNLLSFDKSGKLTAGSFSTTNGGAVAATTYNGLSITNNGSNTLNIAAGKTLAASNSLTLAGADSKTVTFGSYNLTFTTSADSSLTLPTTGTLATLAGSEALTNKSVNGLTNTTATATTANYTNSGDGVGGLMYSSAANAWTYLARGSNGQCLTSNSTTILWGACGGASSTPLSSITAAAGANTIANGDNAQTWNWIVTTSGKTAFTFGVQNGNTTAAGQAATGLALNLTGAAPLSGTNTTTGINISATALANNSFAGLNFGSGLDNYITSTANNFSVTSAGNVSASLYNGLAITNNGTNTLTIAAGKTLTSNNTLTLAGTDGKTLTTNANITLGGTDGSALSLAGNLTTSGAFATTLTATGTTSLTLPTTGTLATLAGSEALTNKTVNGLSITSTTGTLTIAAGKTLTASNTLTFTGTDGSSVAFGTGGTVCYTGTCAASSVRLDQIAAATTTATIANANNAIAWNWGSLTTQAGLTMGGGTAMTTGSVLALGSGTYVHTALNDVGSLAKITFSDNSTNANNGGVTNGLNIAATVNTSGAGTKTINGVNVAAPTLTGCATGGCTVNGAQINTATSGAASTITQNGLSIVATGVASGTLNGLSIGAITGGAGAETAMAVGSGWDNVLTVNSQAILNGTGVLQSAGLSGTYSNALTLSSSSNVFSGTTYNGLAITNNGTNTLAIAAGKTLTASNSITLAGTDGKTLTTNANITLGGTDGSALSLAGNLTTSGAFATTLTATGTTTLTLPTTGTLATLAGNEALTNKTVNGLSITAGASSALSIAAGKTLTASNTLTFTGTDGSSVAFGTGGTVCYSGTCAASSVGFANVSAGTNTNALVIGTGGSLGVSGTGTISATSVPLSGIAAAGTTATIANGSNAIAWNWGSITTQTGLALGGGSAMTTGSIFAIGTGTYVHTALNDTGSVAKISFTDASTNANNGGVTNGLNIAATINTSGAGTKTINGLNVAAPTLTACATGGCTVNGAQVNTATSGAASTITQNGLAVIATGVASGTLNGIYIGGITGAVGTETAVSVGSGWDNVLMVNSQAILNGSGVLQSAGLSGTYSNALTLSSSSNVFTGSTYNGLAITNNGTNTLNIAAGKTLTVSNTLTFGGTDSTSFTLPTSNDTLVGLSAAQTLTSKTIGSTGIDFAGATSPGVSGAGTGRIYYDSATNRFMASENGGAYINLLGGYNKTITLSPEYAGATLSTDGSSSTNGSMTSDTDSANGYKNYYQWTSTQATLQDYSVIVRATLPQDFGSWQSNAFTVGYKTGTATATDNALNVSVQDYTASQSSAISGLNSTTWATQNFASTSFTSAAAGDVIIFKLKLRADSAASAAAYAGDITINYVSKF